MRTQTLAASVGGALLAATVVAVPAVATSGSTAFGPSATAQPAAVSAAAEPAPKPLTEAQQGLVREFLDAHPGAAQALASRAQGWKTFADAHPGLAAELAKVAALPVDQRKAELSAWLKAHPDEASALKGRRQDLRQDRRENLKQRHEKAQDRRDQRRDRRAERRDAKTPTPSATSSSSSSATSSSST